MATTETTRAKLQAVIDRMRRIEQKITDDLGDGDVYYRQYPAARPTQEDRTP